VEQKMIHPSVKFDLLISVCDKDSEIASEAIASIVDGVDVDRLTLTIVDDASVGRAGESIAAHLGGMFSKIDIIRMAESRGFRGTSERFFTGWKHIHDCMSGDYMIKLDPDALCVRAGFLDQIAAMNPAYPAGHMRSMRRKDAVAWILDLAPIGLKRRSRGAWIEKDFRLGRWRSVWWRKMGITALFRGWRFYFPNGGCMVIPRDVVSRVASQFLDHADFSRFGLMTSEDDVLAAVAAHAVGESFQNLRISDCNAMSLWIHSSLSFSQALEMGLWVVHPIKKMDDPFRTAWRYHREQSG
jgi:hypothetical protein